MEGFLAHYAADSKITDLDGNVLMDLEAMREQYDVLFRDSPDLTARIANRIVVGDLVIDEEEIHEAHHPYFPSHVHAAVAYHVTDDKIDRVVFLKIEYL